MTRPVTQQERQLLSDNPELVMFMPRHQGLEPIVFLLVVPVISMVVLGGGLYLTGMLFTLVEAAPIALCLVYVAICAVLMPLACLRIKMWYDETRGCDRELRSYLRREDLVVEAVRITGFEPQRAELYADTKTGPLMIGIAGTRNTFVPEPGTRIALLYTGEIGLAVQPDPRTASLLD